MTTRTLAIALTCLWGWLPTLHANEIKVTTQEMEELKDACAKHDDEACDTIEWLKTRTVVIVDGK